MNVCIPLESDGSTGRRWGKAERVAVAVVEDGDITDWQEHDVRWDVLHDEGTEGSHHARIARFLREHDVDVVVAGHMGEGMTRMLGTMKIRTVLGASGPAREAVRAAVAESAAE